MNSYADDDDEKCFWEPTESRIEHIHLSLRLNYQSTNKRNLAWELKEGEGETKANGGVRGSKVRLSVRGHLSSRLVRAFVRLPGKPLPFRLTKL